MALITIIISLFLDRALRHTHDLRDTGWFESYAKKSIQTLSKTIKLNNGWVHLSMVMVFPVLLVSIIQFVLSDFFYGLFYFLFGILIVFYCLGPTCLSSEVDTYLDARSIGDDDEALHYAGVLTGQVASTAPDQQTNEVTRAILSIANERVFSVLFWFVLLGPVGAVLYRLTVIVSSQEDFEESTVKSASMVTAFLAWLPARLLAIGYALTGHFDGAIQAYRTRSEEVDFLQSNQEVLITTGMGALRHQRMTDEISCIRSARDLVVRSIIIWIAVLSLLTLGGWLS